MRNVLLLAAVLSLVAGIAIPELASACTTNSGCCAAAPNQTLDGAACVAGTCTYASELDPPPLPVITEGDGTFCLCVDGEAVGGPGCE